MHTSKNQVGYEVISENPTTNKGLINNPAKVAKFSLNQEYFKKANRDENTSYFLSSTSMVVPEMVPFLSKVTVLTFPTPMLTYSTTVANTLNIILVSIS